MAGIGYLPKNYGAGTGIQDFAAGLGQFGQGLGALGRAQTEERRYQTDKTMAERSQAVQLLPKLAEMYSSAPPGRARDAVGAIYQATAEKAGLPGMGADALPTYEQSQQREADALRQKGALDLQNNAAIEKAKTDEAIRRYAAEKEAYHQPRGNPITLPPPPASGTEQAAKGIGAVAPIVAPNIAGAATGIGNIMEATRRPTVVPGKSWAQMEAENRAMGRGDTPEEQAAKIQALQALAAQRKASAGVSTARVPLLGAQAGKATAETGLIPTKQKNIEADTTKKGAETGLATARTDVILNKLTDADRLLVETYRDTLRDILADPDDKAAAAEAIRQTLAKYQGAGAAQPAVPQATADQGGTIRVRRKSDGSMGTLKASDFDPARYERIK